MITNNTYFTNQLYIPHAKPSITSDVTTVSAELNAFIEKYERECLIKCLGFQLFKEFEAQLDSGETNGLKGGADTKWDDLLNGKEYTDPQGKLVNWRGIRFKNATGDTAPNRSFLANYVYYHYEENHDIFRVGVGNVKPKAKNAETASAAPKVIRAWREMVEMIQGREVSGRLLIKNFGFGVDYYNINQEVTLYKFINDMNDDTPDTYSDFLPGFWDGMRNQFGI